ncbi:MAG: phosphonate metabolism protein/1,5-bisphosphokinase (PRPP-forming) PhnN [Rhizobiales bacterium]|nr:phosphonate metabolism protein/1,5-bisphosphokinase (PRPP-forming) PhnN [Hyphomicrobiales bacterium]
MGQVRPGQGALVLIVGPSGAGKDTLIAWLKANLLNPDILFARRVVTRAPDDVFEDHLAMSEEDFHRMRQEGAFAVTWQAHGLHYAIPKDVLDHIRQGGVAVANGSRRVLDAFAEVFPTMVVIVLTVERTVLARRLAARGRETESEIAERLKPVAMTSDARFNCLEIDNSGPIEHAGMAVKHLIEELCGQPDARH